MESKCPVCQTGTLEDWNRRVRQCDSCGFQCDTEDLPRIAAAMDLAKWTIAINLTSSDDPTAADIADKHVEAEKRVLEVFGGE